MTYTSNIFSLPLLILIWLIEAYLFMAVVRLIVARIPNAKQTHLCQNLKLIVDFVPETLKRKLSWCKNKSIPSWMAWFIVLLSGFIIRQILIVIVTT